MKRTTKQWLSALLAIVMLLGLLVVPAAADDGVDHIFDPTVLTNASSDKEAMTAAEIKDPYFTLVGTVNKRSSDKAGGPTTSVETDKDAKGGIKFTVTGTAKVEVVFSSTGTDNSSLCGIVDADNVDTVIEEDAQQGVVKGSANGKTTFTYTDLPAGNYLITSPKTDGTAEDSMDRGARVYSIKVTETGATGGDATESAGASPSTGTEATASPSTEATASPSTEASPSTGTEETTPTAPIDERIWGVPANFDPTTIDKGGVVVADWHGVSLSVPASTWSDKMKTDGDPTDNVKAWGLVNKGLMSNTKAASNSADPENSKVVPKADQTDTVFTIAAGTAYIFTVGADVPKGTQVAVFTGFSNKSAWLLENGKLMAMAEGSQINSDTKFAADPGPLYFPVTAGNTYTFFVSGGNAILYGFAVIGPDEEELQAPGAMDKRIWPVPADFDATTIDNGGVVVADWHGVTLSVPASNWSEKMATDGDPTDNVKAWGLVNKGLMSGTKASNDSAEVKPKADQTDTAFTITKGTAYIFKTDANVKDGTQVAIFTGFSNKSAWLLEGDKLMAMAEGSQINSGTGFAADPGPLYFPVKANTTYTFFISSGNAILYGFAVIGPDEEKLKEPVVTKPDEPTPTNENEWIATETSVKAIETFNKSLKFEQETEIPSDVTKVTGVKFYLGGTGKEGAASTYSFSAAKGGYSGYLSGDQNPVLDTDKGAGLTLDNPIPVGGSYFKWTAEGYGALEIECILNENKSIYITKNGEGIDGFFDVQLPKTQTILTIPVAAEDTVYLALNGSKPMLVRYRFIKTDAALEEVEIPWTMNDIAGTPKTTVTPSGANLNVTVEGPRTGSLVAPPQLQLYADAVIISLYDEQGKLVESVESTTPGTTHTASLTPPVTGNYTVKVTATRSTADKDLELYNQTLFFDKPLAKPVITTVQVLNNGALRPNWNAVGAAEKIEVLVDGKVVQTIEGAAAATATAGKTLTSQDGLTIGTPANITVKAYKEGTSPVESDPKSVTPSAEAQYEWTARRYGISVTTSKNTFAGGLNANDTSKLVMTAKNGGGKFLDSGQADGVMIYYTSVPADQNFTFHAKVHVDEWTYGGGQEAMGLVVMDSVPSDDLIEQKFFTNEIFVGGMRLSYWYDFANGVPGNAASPSNTYKKVNERLGVATRRKLGLTPDTLALANENDPDTLNDWCPTDDDVERGSSSTPMLYAVPGAGSYNLIGGLTAAGQDALKKANYEHLPENAVTDLDLTITKNNTGYWVTYTPASGKPVTVKTYGNVGENDAMAQLDANNVYVGFFASRNVVISVERDGWSLDAHAPSEDPAPETKPPEKVYPAFSINSAESSNKADYDLVLNANVDGEAVITFNGEKQAPVHVKRNVLESVPFTLSTDNRGKNTFSVVFTPDADQFSGSTEYELANANVITVESFQVDYFDRWSKMDYLYVGPFGSSGGRGTRTSPIDLKTAIESARPGQTIVVMPGHFAGRSDYTIADTYTIPKGTNGTAEKPISMIADPEADHRPVLDFNLLGGGLRLAGDYWYIYGLDFTKSTGAGLQVSGNHNTIVNVKAYGNGKAGIALERLSSTAAKIEDWPSDNLIKNCEAYNNADGSHQDADGFTAKLTCGRGNVFDGCVAHHNADDGWDMFAKADYIGDVTVRNCLAYKNGYLFDAQGNEFQSNGNGNGFKLGGNDMPGEHHLINSYAYYNAAKGIDSNSGSNCIVENCTSFNNGIGTATSENEVNGYNYAMYTGASSSGFVLKNLISLKDEAAFKEYTAGAKSCTYNNAKDNLVPKGKQKSSSLRSNTNYFWNEVKGASLNKAGDEITAADFVSLDPNQVAIGEDGSISMNGFLELKVDKGVGAGSMADTAYEAPTVGEETGEVPAASGGSSSGGRRDEDRGTTSGEQTGTTTETTSPVIDTTASKATDMDGNTEIVVKDKDGNTVADVKIPATVPAPETSFVDVPAGHWAEDSINALAGMGLVNGVGNDRYDMTSPVTRGAIATILYRLADGTNAKENTFTDVTSGQWYTDAVAWAATVGVVTGYTDGTFGPNNTITRQELAVMIVRLAKLIGMDTGADAAALDSFVDAASVGSWATSDLAWCVANGIVNGKGANNLDPAASVTRAEAATMINRFIDLVK